MTVKTIGTGTIIIADEWKYVRRKGTSDIVESVALSQSDTAENWEDYDMNETRYSVRKLIAELKAICRFAAFRAFLEASNYDWDFVGSNYLSSNDADFKSMISAVVAQGILTQAEIDEMLQKCLWSAD